MRGTVWCRREKNEGGEMKPIALLIAGVGLATLATGCASTDMTSFRDPEFSSKSFKRIAVVVSVRDLRDRQYAEKMIARRIGVRINWDTSDGSLLSDLHSAVLTIITENPDGIKLLVQWAREWEGIKSTGLGKVVKEFGTSTRLQLRVDFVACLPDLKDEVILISTHIKNFG